MNSWRCESSSMMILELMILGIFNFWVKGIHLLYKSHRCWKKKNGLFCYKKCCCVLLNSMMCQSVSCVWMNWIDLLHDSGYGATEERSTLADRKQGERSSQFQRWSKITENFWVVSFVNISGIGWFKCESKMLLTNGYIMGPFEIRPYK